MSCSVCEQTICSLSRRAVGRRDATVEYKALLHALSTSDSNDAFSLQDCGARCEDSPRPRVCIQRDDCTTDVIPSLPTPGSCAVSFCASSNASSIESTTWLFADSCRKEKTIGSWVSFPKFPNQIQIDARSGPPRSLDFQKVLISHTFIICFLLKRIKNQKFAWPLMKRFRKNLTSPREFDHSCRRNRGKSSANGG